MGVRAKVVGAPRLSTRRHGCGRTVARGPHRGTDAILNALFCSQCPRCGLAARGLQRSLPMHRFILVLSAGLLASCRDALQLTAPAAVAAAAGSAPYSFVDLGTLGGYTEAAAISDLDQVAGSGWTAAGTQHAFLWAAGVMRDLGTLGGDFSVANGINASGQVVGRSSTASGELHAFRWTDGLMEDIGPNFGVGTVLINTQGQVAWTAPVAGGAHAMLWDAGTVVDLGTLGGPYSFATALNDRGEVVGSGRTAEGVDHAFYWSNGVMRDLGTLGGSFSNAVAVSANGQVTGMAYYSDREAHAFLWDGHMTDLGALHDFAASWGVALNARGDVIGQSSSSTDNPEHSRPFLWRRGVLSALREPAPYAPALSANAVNNRGQVAGEYFRYFPSSAQVAVVWEDGVMWELGQWSRATAINQRGDVVGSANGRAALWRRKDAQTTTPLVATRR